LLLTPRLALALASFALAACSGPHDEGGDAGPDAPVELLGDATAPPDFDFLVLQADNTVTPVSDGGTVPIVTPPQGGRVVFVGVRATNIDGFGLQLTGALRDLKTQQVQFDSRTVNLIATGDGWGVSGTANEPVAAAIANFSNIAVCPNEWSSTDIYGHEYGLEVTIQDKERRPALTKTIRVTPQCAEPMALGECLCICKAGYVLGQPCDDAGGPDSPAEAGDAANPGNGP
jgi:hypothetical protein